MYSKYLFKRGCYPLLVRYRILLLVRYRIISRRIMSTVHGHAVPKETVEVVEGLHASKCMETVEVFGRIAESLRSAGCLNRAHFHCEDVLPHTDNRSKLMLNARKAHKVCANVRRVGCDKKELEKNAYAFELSPIPDTREWQLQKNRDLATRSKGLLADVTGKERILSVGSSHATAGIRAGNARCVTPEPSLQDADGKFDVLGWRGDSAAFAEVSTGGWSWDVFRHDVTIAFPWLPDFAQKALNGSQTVGTAVSETEAICATADAAMQAASRGVEIVAATWKTFAEEAITNNSPCAKFSGVLADFTRLYGGGDGAPDIVRIDAFCKSYVGDRTLGSEVWSAITYTSFGIPMRGVIRQAIVAAAMTCPEDMVDDGRASLITKTDVSKISSKKLLDTLNGVESIIVKAKSYPQAPDDAVIRMMVRMILFMVDKQQHAFDKREFSCPKLIGHAFLEEIGVSDIPEPWHLTAEEMKAKAKADKTVSKPPEAPMASTTGAVSVEVLDTR